MSEQNQNRLEKNVAGPFYTNGDCLACAAPEYEAPDLLAPLEGDNYDTYFVRQPKTRKEIEQACRAIEVCCVAALQYGGTDPKIVRRLGNDPAYCDYVLPVGLVPRPEDWMRKQCEPARLSHEKRWWQFWRRIG